MITARTPGKIILTGEHAVVYGRPALLMAVNRYATARISDASALQIILNDQAAHESAPDELAGFKQEVDRRYRAFEDTGAGLAQVVPRPEDLIRYAVADFHEQAASAPQGIRVAVASDLPIGCGMGSSAAVILSVLKALAERHRCGWDSDRLYKRALHVEHLQHGRSSGADPFACLHGGFIKFRTGAAERIDLPPVPFSLVHTGKPASTTGACVAEVAGEFANSAIWEQFEAVERYIEAGIRGGDTGSVINGIRKNHELLSTIGVVPERVGAFIHQIERAGGAAKICGAGAIDGDAAGMVLIYGLPDPNGICEPYGYERMNVKVDEHGSRIV